MKYRLALDLGVGSIGGAVLSLNDDNRVTDIRDAGVCIFEVSEGAEERRAKRQARKNFRRRRLRLSLLSQALVQAGLWTEDELEQNDLIKLSPYAIRAQAVNGRLNNIKELGRAILHIAKHRGAGFVDIQKIEIEAQEDSVDNKPKKSTISEYAKLDKYIKETKAKTVGEYFYMRLHSSYKSNRLITDKHTRFVRQTKNALKNNVDYAIPRYLVKEEFNMIWDKQAIYCPQLRDESLKKKIYDILFYEKHHRPYAVGKCIFIRDEDRLPKSHPLSEMRRIYETTNNIIIQEQEMQRKLSLSERDLIISEILLKGQNAGKQNIKKLLHLDSKATVVLSDERIKPYLYSTEAFRDIEFFKSIDSDKLADIVSFMAEPRIEENPDYLYNSEEVIERLKSVFGMDDDAQIAKLIALVPKERTSLGITATTAVLELLKENVISLREATDIIAQSDQRFISEEEQARILQGSYDLLPYYGEILKTDTQPIADWLKKINTSLNEDERIYGKIANPGVHRILNQLRKFVNDIIRIYGKPYDINIELAREVGMSTKKKAEYDAKQKANQKLNDEADEYLKNYNLPLTSKNRLKYKLAKEQGWKDVFDPKSHISSRFEGMEIEHLIPRSVGGTDAPINRVLISGNSNKDKGNLYPYEYLQKNRHDELYKILDYVRKNENMPKGKKWRFESDAREKFEVGDDEDNITRYLTDTRYVCKLAARYLKTIVDYKSEPTNKTRVLTINGGHTAELRKTWNLSGLEYELMGIDKDVPKYLPCEPYYYNPDTGEARKNLDTDGNWQHRDKRRNPNWTEKPRIDHRHHIIDAIVIGCVCRSDMQKINWSDNRGLESPLKQLDVPIYSNNLNNTQIKSQLSLFRTRVYEALKDINAYHKPERSKLGKLHKETSRAIITRTEQRDNDILTRYSRQVSSLLTTKSNLNNLLVGTTVKSEWNPQIESDRIDMIALKNIIESNCGQAELELIKENEVFENEGKKKRDVSEKSILVRAFNMALGKKLPSGKKIKYTYPVYKNMASVIPIEKHKVAYDSGNNYRIDFYKDDCGKVGWECVNMFDANRSNFVPEWVHKGGKVIWSICVGDMIELDTPEQWKRYTENARCFAVVKKIGKGKIGIKYHSDARTENGQGDTALNLTAQDSITDKGLIFCTTNSMRKIELTPFGKIARKHKRLWNGKKETIK